MIDPRRPDFDNTPASPGRPHFGYAPAEMSERPAVSVITPFYNVGEVFHETARCVLAQSLQNFEWIIVNDASADPAAIAVLDQYRGRDARIRVVDLERNRGLPGARNAGFAAARAPYVYQLDGDDLIEPTTLEISAWHLAFHPACAFVKGYSVGFAHKPYLWTRGCHEGAAMLEENLISATAMVRRDAWERVGGYDETLRTGCEDWDFWLRLAYAGLWGATIPEHLDWYRRRPNHAEAFPDRDAGERTRALHKQLRSRYPNLTASSFPSLPRDWPMPMQRVPDAAPFANPLAKSRPRLLMVLPWLTIGGADKFNLHAVRELTRRGWEVSIVTTLAGDHSWLPDFTALTPDVFVTSHFCAWGVQPLFIRSLIESRRPDVVMVSNSELGYWLLPYLRAHCPGPAYVDCCHMEEEYWKSGGYPRYAAACRDELDLSIVVSEHLRGWMVARGADPDRVETCYINVDAGEWRPDTALRQSVRKELGIAEDEPVIVFAGRLTAQKQPRVLMESLLLLNQRGRDFTAVIAGDGPDKAWADQFVERHGLRRRVRMLGPVPGDRVRGLLAAADVFFLPSKMEGIALSIYEAMAMGLAVVGADVGGQRELVTPDAGLLVERAEPEREAARYAEALDAIIGDSARRRAMGRAARERVERHFDLPAMGERLEALLRRAAELSRGTPRGRVGPATAEECAVRAMEYQRVHDLCEKLWAERDELRSRLAMSPASGPRLDDTGSNAERELDAIESSRAWRTMQRLKENPVYGALARLRWGGGWQMMDSKEPPAARLARIKNSNSYRFIMSLKRSPLYRFYSSRKRG